MIDRAASRRGAAGIAPLLMILSFVAMAGLLFWLNATAEGTQAVIVEEPEEVVDPLEAAATDVTADQIRLAPETLEGQRIRIFDVAVLQPVGPEAFYIETGQGGAQSSAPFLAKLGPDLLAQGQAVPQGQVTLVGDLTAMNDSIVEAWASSGAIGAGERPLVEFSTHFLEVLLVR